jgi:hypothetical protein
MKKIILFFLLFSNVFFAQESNDKIIYLDSIWKESTKENYSYYRIIKEYNLEKEAYTFEDYFKSGKIQMRGNSESREYLQNIGEFNYYFENGTLKKTISYEKGKPKGNYTEWYDNGQKCLEGEYIADDKNGTTNLKIQNYWDVNNVQKVVDGNGLVVLKNELYEENGLYKNGFKEGKWIGEAIKSDFSYEEFYTDGKLVNGISTENDGTKNEYTSLEVRPEPKKGFKDFYKYIGKKFSATDLAYKNKVKGRIILGFIVDKSGKIVEIKVHKGLGFGLDEEAIRVLSSYENWHPALQKGRKVRCSYSLPIMLDLSK